MLGLSKTYNQFLSLNSRTFAQLSTIFPVDLSHNSWVWTKAADWIFNHSSKSSTPLCLRFNSFSLVHHQFFFHESGLTCARHRKYYNLGKSQVSSTCYHALFWYSCSINILCFICGSFKDSQWGSLDKNYVIDHWA